MPFTVGSRSCGWLAGVWVPLPQQFAHSLVCMLKGSHTPGMPPSSYSDLLGYSASRNLA